MKLPKQVNATGESFQLSFQQQTFIFLLGFPNVQRYQVMLWQH